MSRSTAWQRADVVRNFVEERRAALPYGGDQIEMLLHLVAHFRPDPAMVIDLGCGDGLLARAVLSAYPEARALLVDNSEPMLERARQAMAAFAGRYEILRADLNDSLSASLGQRTADLVVSGYAIHHLEDARKRSLYGEIFELLKPGGGLFVNVEHVSSVSARGEALFDAQYIDHVTDRSGKPRAEVARAHLTRPDKADNRLAPLETQLEWLRVIGFTEVDCYFKWLELAVFAAVKPPEG